MAAMHPLHRTTLPAGTAERPLRLATGQGLFSADRIDDGTRLLLAHLPATPPRSLLDLGCGYGALGLPIAAAHPECACLLVDRDVLAVEFCQQNVRINKLGRVEARPSLGYRELDPEQRFDWVLCNVPARIGEDGIALILGGGAMRLNAGGELRVVVIRDLKPVVERIGSARNWPIRHVADGERHAIYALGPLPPAPLDEEAPYRHDTVRVARPDGALELERPADLSEDPGHLREGLPLLLECLPRRLDGVALAWRVGAGAVPITLARRGIVTLAADRDLLALAFARRNGAKVGVSFGEVRAHWLPAAIDPTEPPKLVVAEATASLGADALRAELAETQAMLPKGAELLWLSHRQPAKGVVEGPGAVAAAKLATRGSYAVYRLSGEGGRRDRTSR